MNIRLADYNDEERWDAFVENQPGSSPYHLFAWKKAIECAYGHKTYYLIAEENNRFIGLLPFVYFKMPVVHGCFVSSPYCDVGDAVATDDNVKEQLILKAISIAKSKKAKYVELRGNLRHMPFQDMNLSVKTMTHKVRILLDLPDSSVILWDSFKSKLRSQIRKAEKNDLVFKWANIDDLDDFYEVFSRNMHDLGSPVHSKNWFFTILSYYGENARMGLVYHNGKPVGTGIMLSNSNSISIPWASTLRDYNRFSPSMMLYWKFLEYASDNGYKRFDFGRSTPGEGTYKFKTQWGASPEPLYWNYILISKRAKRTGGSKAFNRELIENIWRRLPLPVVNYIGSKCRKYISL